MARVKVSELKSQQVIYDEDPDDWYRVYSEPFICNGKWMVEVTTTGDYVHYFTENDIIWDSSDRKD